MDLTSLSKFLSYVLRHHPEEIGLQLDDNGWAEVSELIHNAQSHGKTLDRDILQRIMQQGSKQRFIFSEDGQYIRAGYGHSIDVDLAMKSEIPPDKLYHGTAERYIASILSEGLRPGNRNFVHLSATRDEAQNVGSRHGTPVILTVEAKRMSRDSYDFYQSESESGIWLTKVVPSQFIKEN